jgi:molybdenum cofactor biosynthesis enzyme MoaA
MEIDTLRVLVDWKCNLKCPYCCNEQEHSRSQFKPANIYAMDFSKYANVCISGGEPLMFLSKVAEICRRTRSNQMVILYTNGILMTKDIARMLPQMNIRAVNVGLHFPNSFKRIITNVLKCTEGVDISVRFHVHDLYKNMNLETEFPNAAFKYWVMDDCDRGNEERIIMTPWYEMNRINKCPTL